MITDISFKTALKHGHVELSIEWLASQAIRSHLELSVTYREVSYTRSDRTVGYKIAQICTLKQRTTDNMLLHEVSLLHACKWLWEITHVRAMWNNAEWTISLLEVQDCYHSFVDMNHRLWSFTIHNKLYRVKLDNKDHETMYKLVNSVDRQLLNY